MLIVLAVIFGILIIAVTVLSSQERLHSDNASSSTALEKPKYSYKAKPYLVTYAERGCYQALSDAAGDQYHVFPQVHLSAIVDNKVVGQNWQAAFRHINQKSVDFVLCDKRYLSPRLAVEFDDRSHARPDRIERDGEVERILSQAGLPLLRIPYDGKGFNTVELSKEIKALALPLTNHREKDSE